MTFEQYVAAYSAGGPQLPVWTREETGLEVFVRCAIRVRGGFEIANVTLLPELQKQGIFSAFLKEYEERLALTIQNVNNPHLRAHLDKRNGWHKLSQGVAIGSIGTNTYVNRRWILEGRGL